MSNHTIQFYAKKASRPQYFGLSDVEDIRQRLLDTVGIPRDACLSHLSWKNKNKNKNFTFLDTGRQQEYMSKINAYFARKGFIHSWSNVSRRTGNLRIDPGTQQPQDMAKILYEVKVNLTKVPIKVRILNYTHMLTSNYCQ